MNIALREENRIVFVPLHFRHNVEPKIIKVKHAKRNEHKPPEDFSVFGIL